MDLVDINLRTTLGLAEAKAKADERKTGPYGDQAPADQVGPRPKVIGRQYGHHRRSLSGIIVSIMVSPRAGSMAGCNRSRPGRPVSLRRSAASSSRTAATSPETINP